MHERKALMADLADAFIALPGGVGTFEELFEVITWTQLGLHAKPCGLLNVDGFYDDLLRFLDHAWAEGFIKPETRAIVKASADPGRAARPARPRGDAAGAALDHPRRPADRAGRQQLPASADPSSSPDRCRRQPSPAAHEGLGFVPTERREQLRLHPPHLGATACSVVRRAG